MSTKQTYSVVMARPYTVTPYGLTGEWFDTYDEALNHARHVLSGRSGIEVYIVVSIAHIVTKEVPLVITELRGN